MQIFACQIDGVRLSLHLILYNVICLEIWIILLHEFWHLRLAQIGTHDKNIFHVIRVGQSLEHVKQMLKRSFPSYADERLWSAIGMLAHACSPARHGNYNSKRLFIHKGILPRETLIKNERYPIVKNEYASYVRRLYSCPRMGCGL